MTAEALHAVTLARTRMRGSVTAYRDAVRAAVAAGAPVSQVARAAGCSRQNVYVLIKRQEKETEQ